jgi:hypothetical protein
MRLQTRIAPDAIPAACPPRQIAREFRELVASGVPIRPAGSARSDPRALLSQGYTPKHRFELFDISFYLTNQREDANFRFFVAYVLMPKARHRPSRETGLFPRIFYKDQSLVWRSPTHYIRTENENWIGKGALKVGLENGVEMEFSAEETTNLPLEIQAAIDEICRRGPRVRRDHRAVDRILRRAPEGRFEPYGDFSAPRRRAMTDPRNRINGGREIATFRRPGDPTSLRFVRGYEPDFARGIVDTSRLKSRMYGGAVTKYRIVSSNRKIQFQFVAAPRQVWIIPPQALTTELSSYGVRTVDVEAAEDLCVPGYEYHFIDESEDPPRLYSQIPEGYAGAASELDASRADASAWIEQLPVIREFRRAIGLPR